MAAAAALVVRGCEVRLFESRRKLGGRAGSYLDRASGESIDHCQHVAMGCCTNYLDFCGRTGIDGLFTRHRTLHFFSPDGVRSDFRPSRWLPAPLHLLPALLSLRFLSVADKQSIAGAMMRLAGTPAYDSAQGTTVLAWLEQQRQSPSVIEQFWKPILISALAESLDRASLVAARKVFVDGFMASSQAADIFVPRVPLDELYDRYVGRWLCEHGALVERETSVTAVVEADSRIRGVESEGGTAVDADYVILAVPWSRVASLLSQRVIEQIDGHSRLTSIKSSPISSVHLWFDRPITNLPHAILVGRLSQWLFARHTHEARQENYYQVVISAAHELSGRERQSVVNEVIGDLQAVFPDAHLAALLRWQLITEQNAVFSMQPGIDDLRPLQQTSISNLFLAGDWTRTGWPATMEGAVRSGYLAAQGVLRQLGRPEQLIVPDLRRNWLTKRF
jgi:squalene-associated FAD-dependent desaturase